MRNGAAVDALRANRAETSRRKRVQVLRALDEMPRLGVDINRSSVARHAEVTRQFLYSHPDLLTAITEAQRRPSVQPGHAPDDDADQGLRVTQSVLTKKVEGQRKKIANLRGQLAEAEAQRSRWLGAQLDSQNSVDVEAHAELRLAHNRAVSEVESLQRTVDELRRLNQVLEAELAASREAHSADLAQLATTTGHNVRPLQRPPDRS